MATASETYTWAGTYGTTTYGAALKAFLGITGAAEDTKLQLYMLSAAADCDDFCGVLGATHSPKIWLGVIEWIRVFRQWESRSVGLASVSTGALSEQYRDTTATRSARLAAAGLWAASVVDISLCGAF